MFEKQSCSVIMFIENKLTQTGKIQLLKCEIVLGSLHSDFSFRSVTKRVWAPTQRPFRVCCPNRNSKKGITAGTLEELKERVGKWTVHTKEKKVAKLCKEDELKFAFDRMTDTK